MTYQQGVYNDEGEPLGIETIYDDPPDPDDWDQWDEDWDTIDDWENE